MFPYVIGWQFGGRKQGREDPVLPEFVFTYFEARIATLDRFGVSEMQGPIQLQWSSREGGSYQVEMIQDGTTQHGTKR